MEQTTVADLTVGDIGRVVTVTNAAGSTTGKLVRIDAEASVIDMWASPMGEADRVSSEDVMLGKVGIELTIGRAVVRVRRDTALEVAR